MKKIALFVSILVLCFAFQAFAQEYKVGDKMPNYTNGTTFADQTLYVIPNSNNCEILEQIYFVGEKLKYQVVFPSLIFGISPFGIFDADTKTMFLDNKDNKGDGGSDGLIDEIVKNPVDRDALNDHPYCNKDKK